MLAVAQNVPRDEGRVTSLETKFRLLSSLGRIVLCLKCQSRDSGDSEWIQSSCITVAILDKSPLQGVSFEVVGVEKGNVATSHAKCRPLLAPPRLLRERLAQDPPATTVNPATPTELPLGSPTVLPAASPEVQDGCSVQGEGGIGSPLELPTLREDALAWRRVVLDRCHEHLVARGFGVLELATLDLAHSEDIGHQVAGELGVDYHEYIGDSIYLWIQEARETRDLGERCSGYRARSCSG